MANNLSDIIVHTNEYQTPITREFLDSMPKEVGDEFMDIVTNIPFVKRMISPDRKRAKDLERDSQGRIIVDVTDPHILEDMDYFRPAAKFYEENGCYTFLKPNKNKGSEFQKWFQEEKRRCLEGYVRESDGEWVTGYMYFYLNYALIKLNRQSEKTGVWHQVQHLPDFWEGVYYGFHALHQARLSGKHMIELARRGASKSYRIATIMLHNLTLGEDEEFQTDVNSILTAYTKEYLSEKDGTLSKFEIMRSYLALNTEFKRAMLKQAPSEMIWRQGYKDSMGIAHSTNNIVLGLSVKDDESKIRGKRGMIFFEEMGAFPNLKDVYMNVMDSVKDGDNVFSLLYLVGTAGDAESDFSGARLLLYNPDSFGLLALNNVWSFPGKGTDKFGFFFPAYISRSGCMDHDGNSDVTKAIRAILMSLDEVKRSGDIGAYIKRKAELCITPEDALLKVKANFFPVPEINERLRQLDSNPHIYDDIYVGELVDTGSEVVFRSTDDVPIRRWKVDNTTPGALEIFEMPVKGKDGAPMPNRYIIGNDPVDNDRAESSSLSSTFVFDLATDRIVAEYTGRKDYADKNYQILYNLAKFYNAKILYEANKKGTYAYFARRSSTHMLADCPAYLKQRNLVKYSTFGSAQKGVTVNAGVKSAGLEMMNTWLQKTFVIDVKDEHGQVHQEEQPILYTIRNRALLEEMASFTPGDNQNYDRISAMIQVMLYREEFIILYGDSMGDQNTTTVADDPFFDKDWQAYKARQK